MYKEIEEEVYKLYTDLAIVPIYKIVNGETVSIDNTKEMMLEFYNDLRVRISMALMKFKVHHLEVKCDEEINDINSKIINLCVYVQETEDSAMKLIKVGETMFVSGYVGIYT